MGRKKLTIEIVKQQIEAIHPDIIIPINQKYLGDGIKIRYICTFHGEKTATPSSLKQGSGCMDCAGTKKLTIEIVKQQIEAIHENITVPIEQEYKGDATKIKYICKYHGEKSARPSELKQAKGCSECRYKNSANKQKSNWLDIINKIKLNLPDIIVPDQPYKNVDTKIKIICKKHGEHWSTPWSLFKAVYGCLKCSAESASERKLWIKSSWCKACKKSKGQAIVYWLRMTYQNQNWYKFGITYKGLKDRFKGSTYENIDIEVIKIVSGEPEYIWDLEHRLHRFYRKSRFKPLIEFSGDNECYKIVNENLNLQYKRL